MRCLVAIPVCMLQCCARTLQFNESLDGFVSPPEPTPTCALASPPAGSARAWWARCWASSTPTETRRCTMPWCALCLCWGLLFGLFRLVEPLWCACIAELRSGAGPERSHVDALQATALHPALCC